MTQQYAIINSDNLVIKTINVQDQETLVLNTNENCIAIQTDEILVPGVSIYNPETETFTTNVPQPNAPIVLISFSDWMDQFTFDEQIAIATATTTDPVVKLLYDKLQASSGGFDPKGSNATQAKSYFESKGLIQPNGE